MTAEIVLNSRVRLEAVRTATGDGIQIRTVNQLGEVEYYLCTITKRGITRNTYCKLSGVACDDENKIKVLV